ncbi:DUF3450 domain-containing protein [Aliivibrio salmonicida]|uniref:DUF3450 domain-containing protein n=1 Tax=Aliivibrio salmonicida TaxID=40269 RepID=UPI00406D1921
MAKQIYQDNGLMKKHFLAMLILSLIGLLGISVVSANSLTQAQVIEVKTNHSSQRTQQYIDKEAQKILDLQTQIEQATDSLSNLTLYRKHLTQIVSSQEKEIQQLQRQRDQIEETRQGIIPLMYHMLDELERLLHTDLPIRFTARTERLEQLNALIIRADISDVEKFRRILEAFQIEMDYGYKIAAYQQTITLDDGSQRVVQQLHIGRITLISRSIDKQQAWIWQQDQQQWHSVLSEDLPALDNAFSMAYKQTPPQLLRLPLSVNAPIESNKKEAH